MAFIEIRDISGLDEVDQINNVQKEIWGMDDLEMIPGRFMHAMQFNGACLIGAFEDDKLVGFVFGILGTLEGLDHRIDQVAAARLQLYSVIMGVLPDYQVLGVGFRLKTAQRDFAMRIGVRLITWTFDPLESRNAHFNFSKLGTVAHQYVRNYHGRMGGINAGLKTDRFYVEWWITSNRVKSRVSRGREKLSLDAFLDGGATFVNKAVFEEDDLPVPPNDFVKATDNILLVEIPSSIQKIKKLDMPLALRWRQHTRLLFEHFFLTKYLVTDFVRQEDPSGHHRSYYVLTYADS